jgi:hypothetical protein
LGFQKAWRWNTSQNQWVADPAITFETLTGLHWHTITITPQYVDTGGSNNDRDNRGYVATVSIPWVGLGYNAPPHGQVWAMGIKVYDRDDATKTVNISPQKYPNDLNESVPNTWKAVKWLGNSIPVTNYGDSLQNVLTDSYSANGKTVHYESPIAYRQAYTPPSVTNVTKLKIAAQESATVGGADKNLCWDGPESWRYFTSGNDPESQTWGNRVHSVYVDEPSRKVNLFVQNQQNVADWPCYSRSYIKFPIASVPMIQNKKIKSARLGVWMLGNNGSYNTYHMLTHVFTIDPGQWKSRNTATWNNAANLLENISGTWVSQISNSNVPPGVNRWAKESGVVKLVMWDISKTVAEALAQEKTSLDLGLTITGSDMHMGFYAAAEGHWANAYNPAENNFYPSGVGHYYDPYIEVEYGD